MGIVATTGHDLYSKEGLTMVHPYAWGPSQARARRVRPQHRYSRTCAQNDTEVQEVERRRRAHNLMNSTGGILTELRCECESAGVRDQAKKQVGCSGTPVSEKELYSYRG